MNKKKKILIAVCLILVACIFIALFVFYKVWPEQTKQYLATAWDWLNAPLPIVGISLLMIFVFAWRFFISTRFGKKTIKKYEEENAKVRDSFLTYKNQIEEQIDGYRQLIIEYENELLKAKETIKSICAKSRNAKIKEIGAKLNEKVEETINNETKTN